MHRFPDGLHEQSGNGLESVQNSGQQINPETFLSKFIVKGTFLSENGDDLNRN